MTARPVLRTLALFVGLAVGSTIVVPLSQAQEPVYTNLPQLQQEASVPGREVPVAPLPANPVDAVAVTELPAAQWPAAAAAQVSLAAPAAQRGAEAGPGEEQYRPAGDLPVSVAATGAGMAARSAEPGQVEVRTFDQDAATRAGVDGVLVSVADQGGASGSELSVRVDYSKFAHAYGGDYGSRLRLLRMPSCVLTTPEKSECRDGELVRTDNRASKQDVTGEVTVPTGPEPVVFAVQAAPSGAGGSFGATDLSPAGSWSAGGSSGDFTYSVPLRVPPASAGVAPKLGLGYSSGAIDGRTSATNNQASIVGDGWELSTGGFIERQYKPCSEDLGGNNQQRKTGDLCWATDNAVLSLNGVSAELVKVPNSQYWRPKHDDGSRIERLTGAVNGDKDGEHWKVTAADGTQYFLGLNRLPGWKDNDPVTNSAYTVPVFGNHKDEPCNATTFGESWCQQGYRWNLDYVVDTNGNATTYYYDVESNHYGRDEAGDKQTPYVAGGQVRRIEYGLRSNALFAPAPARVWFDTVERCLPTATFACNPDQLNKDTAKSWPDVPFDAICKPGDKCDNKNSPAFFTRKRLVKVLTQIRRDDVPDVQWRDVDSWALRHQFPPTGDGLSPALWLSGVQHTGHVGGTATKPEMVFHGQAMPNRVDTNSDNRPPITRHRVQRVVNEAGGVLEVTYSTAQCVPGTNMPANAEHNTMRCFPTWWVPEFGYERELGWFHKYRVDAVSEDSRTTGPSIQKTYYEYSDKAAWHFDDAKFTEMKYRTWSQWRGYELVRTLVGEPGTTRSITEERFLRGMDGDRLPDNGKRSVQVTDSEGGKVTDSEQLAGFSWESLQYDGDKLVSASVKDPWVKGPTATDGDNQAFMTNTASVRGRTLLGDGTWRRTQVNNRFDDYGNTDQVEDLGDTGKTGDETCSRTTYAYNTTAWILNRPASMRTIGRPCSAYPGEAQDLISDVRTSYDDLAPGTPPTKGNVSLTERWTGNAYQVNQRTSYDGLGRTTKVVNSENHEVTTSYAPGPEFLVRTITKTDPLKFTAVTTLEPAWGQATGETGMSGERADVVYDPLGRITKMWKPGRKKDSQTPNGEFDYEYRTDGPTTVTTRALRDGGTYNTSYTLFDGLLRERQQQIPAVNGGRVLSDFFFDSRGLQYKINGAYFDESEPSKTLHEVLDNAVPNQTINEFDALQRETAVIYRHKGVEQWRTSSSYGGDRTTVIPPRGGTTTTVIKDVQGRIVERRQHHTADPASPFDTTRYAFNSRGQQESMTGADGAVWRYDYDELGRKKADHDPDSGTSTYTYDTLDRLLTSTDARGHVMRTEYDALGRKTAEFQRPGADQPEVMSASWAYDWLKKGLLDSSTRWVNGQAYTKKVNAYDDALRPTSTSIVIPDAEQELKGDYKFSSAFDVNTGALLSESHPAAGSLSRETIQHRYNSVGLPTTTFGVGTYVSDTLYTKYGETQRMTMGSGAKTVTSSMFYEEGTRRLQGVDLQRNTANSYLAKRAYSYDPAGNITRIDDAPPGSARDVQCFSYDYLQRMTQAFTPASGNCEQQPTVAGLGGAAPYWNEYKYDTSGNRIEDVQHRTDGDVTRTYAYGAEDGSQPHTLRSVTQVGPNGTAKDEFGYDAAGNQTLRNVAGSPQTMEFDTSGRNTKVTEHDGRTYDYLYDAEGNRLIKRTAQTTTLYLGGMELRLDNTTKTVSGSRYYNHGGSAVAVRTSGPQGKLSYLLGDHQGTAGMSVDAGTLDVTTRRQDPFGNERGEQPQTWPDDRGFVGGTKDESGLTHLGAREYDPKNGRFTSVDPVLDQDDPQQINGYAYANNSPVTNSDPNGLYWKTVETWKLVKQTTLIKVMYWLSFLVPFFFWVTVTYWAVQVFVYRVWIEPPWKGRGSQQVSDEQAAREAGLSLAEYEEAKRAAADKRSWVQVAIEHGGEVVQEIIGAKGVIDNCFTNFNAVQCGLEIFSALPWGKIMKIGKIIGKIVEAFEKTVSWIRGKEKAEASLRSVEKARERLQSSCPTSNSFVPGTLVLMADGSHKPIEQVELGDQVHAVDPISGESRARVVTAIIVGTGIKDLVELTVNTDTGSAARAVATDGGDGKVTATAGQRSSVEVGLAVRGESGAGAVVATDEHPFWVAAEKRWVNAVELKVGHQLETGDNRDATVTGTRSWSEVRRVYNLTVDTDHTYYVLAGTTPVLTHNEACTVGRWMSEDEYQGMRNTGKVQAGSEGASTYVASPADPASFRKQAAPGSIYAEFDVPCSCLKPAGEPGWSQIPGPKHPIYSKLNAKRGLPPPGMPNFENLRIVDRK
ncbi:TreTu family toxin [Amycolatopsis magusensis]|uniref:TreTu family toxin n=1 Tax=Amycolatopsis magusensis TaxID=882444 RepID=UPI0024A9A84D|nr:RHS repeat-associated core domain-containing protein [Amycolatopsis magusensis]MDI5974642.1 RHS repeat-associated core domain-containing protein [Amycolatopsis magusensis]